MSTRRMAYWWLRFVVSGRFLEKFLNLRRSPARKVVPPGRITSPEPAYLWVKSSSRTNTDAFE